MAPRLNAEIVSMDSMAIYRRMDIGTAKPTPEQRKVVPHHLIDLLEPWESGSVAWWLDEVKRCVQDIEARGKLALFVGGTPLYLKALISGLFEGPPADEAIRKRLADEASASGSAALHARLAAVDPVSASRLHPNDVRRMIRALEVYELTGKPISAWQTQWDSNRPPTHTDRPAILCLELPREELYDRINRRVVEMFDAGLIDEVRALCNLDRDLSVEAAQAVGYKEILDLLDGSITREEAIVRVQTRSRNFAKRQIAWFRHLPECQPVTIELTRTLWKYKMNA
jgi:tRNA dimethylallyltransferase